MTLYWQFAVTLRKCYGLVNFLCCILCTLSLFFISEININTILTSLVVYIDQREVTVANYVLNILMYLSQFLPTSCRNSWKFSLLSSFHTPTNFSLISSNAILYHCVLTVIFVYQWCKVLILYTSSYHIMRTYAYISINFVDLIFY